MTTTPPRVFAARLAGLPVFDPQGDQVGKVRDVVVVLRSDVRQPRVVGLVAEVFGQRPIFVPMTRVTNIDSGQVITTGLLNMRRFEKRAAETLVIGQMLDRKVRVKSTGVEGVVYDVAMEQARTRDWVLSRVALQEGGKGFRRRGQTHVVAWDDVDGLHRREADQGATNLIASLADLRPADAANVIHELTPERRRQVVAALDDERLAELHRGAARGGPGRDPRAPHPRAGRRRPRGDVRRRRRRPDRRPATGDRGAPARADGARGGPGRAPADGLRRGDGRRHDDPRAGDPLPRRHRRRGARPGPQRGAHPVAGRTGLRLPAAAGDARPASCSASRTSSGCCASRPRSWSPASSTPASPTCTPTPPSRTSPRSWPPTTWSRRPSSTRRAGCSARSRSTTCSTTCCPRAGATARSARHERPTPSAPPGAAAASRKGLKKARTVPRPRASTFRASSAVRSSAGRSTAPPHRTRTGSAGSPSGSPGSWARRAS